jgi:hypothetical protein
MSEISEQDEDEGERACQILELYKDAVAAFTPTTSDVLGIIFREKDREKMRAAMLDFTNFYDLPLLPQEMDMGKSGYIGFFLPTTMLQENAEGEKLHYPTAESVILGMQIENKKLAYFSEVETAEEAVEALNLETKLFRVSDVSADNIRRDGGKNFHFSLNYNEDAVSDMSDEQRGRIEKVYAGTIAMVTVKDELNMLLVFPNTDEGFDERMAVAQAFSATYRGFVVNEKQDFIELEGVSSGAADYLPYPALYLPAYRLKNGVDKEIPEMAVLRQMDMHHVHSDISNEDAMMHLQTFLRARDSAEALLAEENGTLLPDPLSGHILTEDNGFPKNVLEPGTKEIRKIAEDLGNEYPIRPN